MKSLHVCCPALMIVQDTPRLSSSNGCPEIAAFTPEPFSSLFKGQKSLRYFFKFDMARKMCFCLAGVQCGACSGAVQDVWSERGCLLSDISRRTGGHDAVGHLQATDTRLLVQHL